MLLMTKNEIKESIASNLFKIRKELRYTQREVADMAGLNTNYYAKLERGESMVSLVTLEKLVKALSVSTADILPF